MKRLPLALVAVVLFANAAQANINNRQYQSPVRDQQQRGTCTAFAIAGAMEAMPGMPTELSTQYMYAVMKKVEMDRNVRNSLLAGKQAAAWVTGGDSLANYVPVMQTYGAPAEKFLPYNGTAGDLTLLCGFTSDDKFKSSVPQMEFLCHARTTDDQMMRITPYGKYHIGADTEVLTAAQTQDVALLKRMLDDTRPGKWIRSIPVSYTMLASHWSDKAIKGKIALDNHVQIDINAPRGHFRMPLTQALTTANFVFGDSLENLLKTGKAQLTSAVPGEQWGGHAIEIVGYDDTGFIIKNSWGTTWGDAGYGHISFDFHRIFSKEALLIHSVWTKAPAAASASLYFAQYKLKSFYDPYNHVLSLSTYTEDREDPPFTQVTYQVYAQGILGDWQPAARYATFYSSPNTPLYWRSGYGAEFRGVSQLGQRLAVVVTYWTSPRDSTQRTFLDVGQPGIHDFSPTRF